jgi:hypothetical protein
MNMTEMHKYDIFFSYSWEDRDLAARLSRLLATKGFASSFSENDYWSSEASILKTFYDSAVCLVLIGPKRRSPWWHDCISSAIDKRMTSSHGEFRVVSVLFAASHKVSVPEYFFRPFRAEEMIHCDESLTDPDQLHELILLIRGARKQPKFLASSELREWARVRAKNGLSVDWAKLWSEYHDAVAARSTASLTYETERYYNTCPELKGGNFSLGYQLLPTPLPTDISNAYDVYKARRGLTHRDHYKLGLRGVGLSNQILNDKEIKRLNKQFGSTEQITPSWDVKFIPVNDDPPSSTPNHVRRSDRPVIPKPVGMVNCCYKHEPKFSRFDHQQTGSFAELVACAEQFRFSKEENLLHAVFGNHNPVQYAPRMGDFIEVYLSGFNAKLYADLSAFLDICSAFPGYEPVTKAKRLGSLVSWQMAFKSPRRGEIQIEDDLEIKRMAEWLLKVTTNGALEYKSSSKTKINDVSSLDLSGSIGRLILSTEDMDGKLQNHRPRGGPPAGKFERLLVTLRMIRIYVDRLFGKSKCQPILSTIRDSHCAHCEFVPHRDCGPDANAGTRRVAEAGTANDNSELEGGSDAFLLWQPVDYYISIPEERHIDS